MFLGAEVMWWFMTRTKGTEISSGREVVNEWAPCPISLVAVHCPCLVASDMTVVLLFLYFMTWHEFVVYWIIFISGSSNLSVNCQTGQQLSRLALDCFALLCCVHLSSEESNVASPSVVPQSTLSSSVHVYMKGVEAEEWKDQVMEFTLQSWKDCS